MKSKRTIIREYLVYIILALSVIVVWYLGTAFVVLELNPANWSESTRFLALYLGLINAIVFIGIRWSISSTSKVKY